jgi:hypothetical protein
MRWLKGIKVPIRHEGEAKPVPIVSDAAIATRGYADGQLIPLVILDTTTRPDIDTMILAHRDLGPGDSRAIWGRPSQFALDTVRLALTVTNPSQCTILIDFDIVRQGGIVDQIVHTEGLYIQGGRPGDRLRTTMDNPKISVEVPSKHFRTEWDKLLSKAQFKEYRRMGLSRSDAKRSTESFIRSWREFNSHRMERDPV